MIVLKDFDLVATKSAQELRDVSVSEEAPISVSGLIVYRHVSGCRFNKMPSDISGLRSNKRESLQTVVRETLLEQTIVFLSRSCPKLVSMLPEVHLKPRQARIEVHLLDERSEHSGWHCLELDKALGLKSPSMCIFLLPLVIHGAIYREIVRTESP